MEEKLADNPDSKRDSDKYSLYFSSSSSSSSQKSFENSDYIKDKQIQPKPVQKFKSSTNIIETQEIVKIAPKKQKAELKTQVLDEGTANIINDAPAEPLNTILQFEPDLEPSPAVEFDTKEIVKKRENPDALESIVKIDQEEKIKNQHPNVLINSNLYRDGPLLRPTVLELEDTLRIFKTLNIPIDCKTAKPLWKKRSCVLSLLYCFGKEYDGLDEALEEPCLKLYRFSKLPYNKDDIFHQSCLLSVYFYMTTETEWPSNPSEWERFGIKNIETDLLWKGACCGLIFVLFMSAFYSNKFKEMLQASQKPDTLFPFLEVLMKLSKIPIKILRTKKLNIFIKSNNNKAFEVIFFFYAGVLLFWYELFTNYHMTMQDFDIMYKVTYRKAKASPKDLIMKAKEVYGQESKR